MNSRAGSPWFSTLLAACMTICLFALTGLPPMAGLVVKLNIMLALALVRFLGQNLQNVVLAISILAVAPIARLVRSATLAV